MLFYDFEVFKRHWQVVMINPIENIKTVIKDDSEGLTEFYNKHKNEIWIGYNSRRYDQFILKGIILGMNPFDISDFIINKKRSGYEYSSLFNKIALYNYDVLIGNDRGLKTLEGYLGNDIRETEIPFDTERLLSGSEIEQTTRYCTHDVEQTIEVFLARQSTYNSFVKLIKMFNLPKNAISKTSAQLSAMILESSKTFKDDVFDLIFPETLELNKYKYVTDWYKTHKNYDNSLEFKVSGMPTVMGWGGIHGALAKYHGVGYFLNMDVESLYPTLMILYGLFSRGMSEDGKKRYMQIYKTRLELKHQHKKKEQAPYKLILNSTYGAMKDRNNNLFDERNANLICLFGQTLLLMLMEMLESTGCEFIQCNTDGVLVRCESISQIDDIKLIAKEWMDKTSLTLEFDEYIEVYQGDVNNYVMIDKDGKTKSKGAYVKELDLLDYDMAIVNKAIMNKLTKNIAVEYTINNCDDLIEFQRVVKVGQNYSYGVHGKKILNDTTFRVFASKDINDGGVFKSKNGKLEKFPTTSVNSFIINDDIHGVKIPDKLDKDWYINLAKTRLADKFNVIEV